MLFGGHHCFCKFFSLGYITDVLPLFVGCSFSVSCSAALGKARGVVSKIKPHSPALVAASGPHAEAMAAGSTAAPK